MKKDAGLRLGIAVALWLAGYASAVYAVERQWGGGADNDWNNAQNWSPIGIPKLSDIVIVPSLPAGGRFPFVVNSDAICQGLIIQTDAQVSVGVDVVLYVLVPPLSDPDAAPRARPI